MPRGPSYPSIALDEAIDLTERLHKFAGTQPVAVEAVLTSSAMLDSSAKSTAAIKKVAALKYFGLVDEIPGGKARQIQISKRAQHIRLNNGREKALREAFLSPKHYKYCWDLWGRDLPEDDAIASHLVIHRKFVESTVGGYIANYRKSLVYSGLLDGNEDGETSDATGEQHDPALTESTVEGAHEINVEASTGTPAAEITVESVPPTHQATMTLPGGRVVLEWLVDDDPRGLRGFQGLGRTNAAASEAVDSRNRCRR